MLFILAGGSFSEVFTTYSHGLRVEIRFKIDKKKIEFYFSVIKKNFLTKKRNARVRGKTENIHCS